MELKHINSKHFKTAYRYAEDIISGKKKANEDRRLACQRFISDLERDDLDFWQDEEE